MIVFDCERIWPNTGIYHFSRNLGRALLAELKDVEGMDIAFFLRKRNMGFLGEDAKYIRFRSLYKYIFPHWLMKGGLWHSTFQYPYIMPSKGNVLLTVHDLNFLYEKMAKGADYWKNRVQESVDKATAVVAISEFAKKDILEHLDLKGKGVTVIHNGCERYDGEISRPAFVPEGEYLYTIGGTLEKKNFHVLPALLKGNDLHLVISGEIIKPYNGKIINEIKKAGVADRVHLTGPVPDAEKHWYLKHCKAFVFPSVAEGFGLPVLEAMYYGKPVFLSDHTSLPEIGGDKAFYFNHGFDPDGMREEFLSGMRRYEKGEVTPEEIKRHAESFSWENAAKEYVKLYKSML